MKIIIQGSALAMLLGFSPSTLAAEAATVVDSRDQEDRLDTSRDEATGSEQPWISWFVITAPGTENPVNCPLNLHTPEMAVILAEDYRCQNDPSLNLKKQERILAHCYEENYNRLARERGDPSAATVVFDGLAPQNGPTLPSCSFPGRHNPIPQQAS